MCGSAARTGCRPYRLWFASSRPPTDAWWPIALESRSIFLTSNNDASDKTEQVVLRKNEIRAKFLKVHTMEKGGWASRQRVVFRPRRREEPERAAERGPAG